MIFYRNKRCHRGIFKENIRDLLVKIADKSVRFSAMTLFLITPAYAGDPVKGEALYNNQRLSLCTLCHDKGNLAPPLVNLRLSEAQLKEVIMDRRKVNPQTIMPPFHSMEGLVNNNRTTPILTLEQIDDLVSYLKTK
jgi:mono/diheme cytochrome c family protein